MRLEKSLILLSFIFVFGCAKAQAPIPVASSKYLTTYEGLKFTSLNSPLWDSKFSESAVAPGIKNIWVGSILTVGGTAILISGIIEMARIDSNEPNEGWSFLTSAVTIAAGAGLIVPGVILIVKGQKKYTAYKSSSASFSLGINKNGAGLRYNF